MPTLTGTTKRSASTRPSWLNKKISLKGCLGVKSILRDLRLETVCEQALCPNIGECFCAGHATFMILGKYCTRSCSFCGVKKGATLPPDEDEPRRIAEAVSRLGLRHVVVTSVTRDDLVDGGAGIFAETVRLIRGRDPAVTIEVLIPDFKLSRESIAAVCSSGPQIIAHNLETVSSLYPLVRRDSDYAGSLGLLRAVKSLDARIFTKSGIMLGLGESRDEVLSVFDDLRRVDCDFLSIGQYLAPGRAHYPVREYVRPEVFDDYRRQALLRGFRHVESAPYVRSSYMAEGYLSGAGK